MGVQQSPRGLEQYILSTTTVRFVQHAYDETESTGPLTPLEIMPPNGMKDDVMNAA